MNPKHYKQGVALETQRVFGRRYYECPRADRSMLFSGLQWAAASRILGHKDIARDALSRVRRWRLELQPEFPKWLGSDADFFDEHTEIEG